MPLAFKMEACECPSDPKVSGFWWGCVGLRGHNLPLVGKLLDPGPVPAAGVELPGALAANSPAFVVQQLLKQPAGALQIGAI